MLEEKSDNIAKEFDDFEQKIEEALDDMRQKIHKKGRFAKHFKEMAQNRKEEYQQQQGQTSNKNRQNNDNENDDDSVNFNNDEEIQAEEFILEETQGTIEAIVNDRSSNNEIDTLLMPPPGSSKMKTNNPTPAGLGKLSFWNFFMKPIKKRFFNETQWAVKLKKVQV